MEKKEITISEMQFCKLMITNALMIGKAGQKLIDDIYDKGFLPKIISLTINDNVHDKVKYIITINSPSKKGEIGDLKALLQALKVISRVCTEPDGTNEEYLKLKSLLDAKSNNYINLN